MRPRRNTLAANNRLPAESGATWNFSTSDDDTTPAKNNGANHLVINSPDGDSSENEANIDYKTTGKKKWRGPYLSRVGNDPWGQAYIAYVGAMEASGTTLSGVTGTQRGWVISAGEDGKLATSPSSTSLQEDDHGFILK